MTSGGIKTLNYPVAFTLRNLTIGGSAGVWTLTRVLCSALSMEHFLVVAVFLLFGVTVCLGTSENTSYCPGMKFESPQVNELIGSCFICSELDFNLEYGWISNLAGKFVRKRA